MKLGAVAVVEIGQPSYNGNGNRYYCFAVAESNSYVPLKSVCVDMLTYLRAFGIVCVIIQCNYSDCRKINRWEYATGVKKWLCNILGM